MTNQERRGISLEPNMIHDPKVQQFFNDVRQRLIELLGNEAEADRHLLALAGYIRHAEKNGQSLESLLNQDPQEYARFLIEQPETNEEYRRRYHVLIDASDELKPHEKTQANREFDWAVNQLDEAKLSLKEIEVRDLAFLAYTKIEALKSSRTIWNRFGWLLGMILAFAYANLLLVIDDVFSGRLFTAPMSTYPIDYLAFLLPVLVTGAIFGILTRFRHHIQTLGRRIAFALLIVVVYITSIFLIQPLLMTIGWSFVIQLTPLYALILMAISGFMAIWTLIEFVWKSTRCSLGDDTLMLYY